MKDTALAAAKEMIKTMEGLADGLQERLRRTEAENEALRKELESIVKKNGKWWKRFFGEAPVNSAAVMTERY